MSEKITSISDDELRKSYWLVTHYRKVLSLFFIVLCVLDGVLGIFVIGSLGKVYLFDRQYAGLFTHIREESARAIKLFPAQPLGILSSGSISTGSSSVDTYTEVVNPNDSYRLHFNYIFIVNGVAQDPLKGILNPGEKRYLLGFRYKTSGVPSVEVQFTNLAWYRVTREERTLIEARTAFAVSDITYKPPRDGEEAFPISSVSFKAKNNTAFHYWDVDIPLVALNGGQVVAINKGHVTQFRSGEARLIDLHWYYPAAISDSSTYIIQPSVDIFDESAYQSYHTND